MAFVMSSEVLLTKSSRSGIPCSLRNVCDYTQAEVEPLVSLALLCISYLVFSITSYMNWTTLSLSGQCLHSNESCTKAVERVVLSVAC